MTSRLALTLAAMVLVVGATRGEEPLSADDLGRHRDVGWLAPATRPVLLRSDALSHANYAKMRSLAELGRDPRTGIAYDWRGFPKFSSLFDVQLTPAQYRSDYYGRICNELLIKEMQTNPALKRRFTQRDMELLARGHNPQGKQWHHDPRHRGKMQLVDATDHTTDHVGGDKVWGRIDRAQFMRSTALRWGSVAVFDVAISSAVAASSGDLDMGYLGRATSRSIAGAAASWGTESILVSVFPQTVGLPPGWFLGVRVLWASPVAIAGSLAYFATRTVVDYCWDSYQLRQFQIQEQACREAESKARWQLIESSRESNSRVMKELLGGTKSAMGVIQ